ncbi:hypothetical protein EHQ12_06250 [Leptospira gomenensis]|uniref:Uncharacterized protein n=1 Tax=Leptospira gomenensis TaxID=2484974 RepID=A0A5F1YC79_9LEPT|nr:hypothetical protein [Leptospira gomenensis]TGK34879.1 hypothetical protein EHQ17_08200 [Leptospira gomenensis]TGK41128.1 hypothetical protein EHQ12_06250 [Leptospira gomenensis]TGK42070.1 hypothetical protein EHQ07_14920 [Leptospira gomenensis]TGK56332.1 hypothetical protein EHQ13_15990 [Leptospira gomenensis]
MKRLDSKFKVPLFLKREDGDLLKIEHSLIKTMSELRNQELRSLRMSDDFSVRLKNQLTQIRPEPEDGWFKIRELVFGSRGLQLSLSAALALALVFAVYNRVQSSYLPIQSERSGTVFGQNETGSFQDIPSSGKFVSDGDNVFLREIPSGPEAKKTIDSLQRYFSEKGDLRTAEELGKIFELTQGISSGK